VNCGRTSRPKLPHLFSGALSTETRPNRTPSHPVRHPNKLCHTHAKQAHSHRHILAKTTNKNRMPAYNQQDRQAHPRAPIHCLCTLEPNSGAVFGGFRNSDQNFPYIAPFARGTANDKASLPVWHTGMQAPFQTRSLLPSRLQHVDKRSYPRQVPFSSNTTEKQNIRPRTPTHTHTDGID
jgi:hypothetical protein